MRKIIGAWFVVVMLLSLVFSYSASAKPSPTATPSSSGASSSAVSSPHSKYPYEVTIIWQMDNPNVHDVGSIEWPQHRVSSVDYDSCVTKKYQVDTYWVRTPQAERYINALQVLHSPKDDNKYGLKPHNIYILFQPPIRKNCGSPTPTPTPTTSAPSTPTSSTPVTTPTPTTSAPHTVPPTKTKTSSAIAPPVTIHRTKAHTPSRVVTSPVAAKPALAATGPHTATMIAVGVGLLIAGGLAMAAARRKPRLH